MIILISIKKAIIKYHQLLVLKRCRLISMALSRKIFMGIIIIKWTIKKTNSLSENKILNNKMTKKINKINEELENKNKLKEFIDNYLDDYFSSNNNLNNNYIEHSRKIKVKVGQKTNP